MFNPAEETEKDWDLDLRDDVKSECESKYGPVVEIRVDKDSSVSITCRTVSSFALIPHVTIIGRRDICALRYPRDCCQGYPGPEWPLLVSPFDIARSFSLRLTLIVLHSGGQLISAQYISDALFDAHRK
jgi:hypothetical protein